MYPLILAIGNETQLVWDNSVLRVKLLRDPVLLTMELMGLSEIDVINSSE